MGVGRLFLILIQYSKPTTTMKKLTKQERIEQSIAEANAIYRKASPAQRRVLIAKDALKQLKDGRVKAKKGQYINAIGIARQICRVTNWSNFTPLQPALHDLDSPACSACARGSLLLSAIRFRNRCGINGFGGLDKSDKQIREFPIHQQTAIEVAFEMWHSKKVGYPKAGAERWWKKYLRPIERRDANLRLAVILRNIIRNKGEFVTTRR